MNFHKLNNTLNIQSLLLEFMGTGQPWKDNFGFKVLPIPIFVYSSNSMLSDIRQKFNGYASLMKLEPMQFYHWHVDDYRSAAINSLITGFDSFSLISKIKHQEYMDVDEILYQQGDIYLMNTQNSHSVYNRSECRIMFSLGFDSPVTYDDIVNYCLEKKYI
jgi:hypothetical protein